MSIGSRPPTWARAMDLNRWYAISGDRPDLGLPATMRGTRYLCDNDPACDKRLNPARTWRERMRRMLGRRPHSPWHGRGGFAAITEAWNSSVYASRYGPSGAMIVFGGGHNNYFGSDVHAFDLESRRWRRISNGFVAGRADQYGAGAVYPHAVYPDGSPLPPHTYDYVQYDPVNNDYLLFKGQTELGPNVKAIAIAHLFNLDTLIWRHGPLHRQARLNSGGCTTWDAKRRILWGHSGDDGRGNAFIGFHPDGTNADGSFGKWSVRHANQFRGDANHNAMQWHPRNDRIIVAVHARNALYELDPHTPGSAPVRLESSATMPALQPYASLQYSAGLDRLIYFSPADNGAVYSIDLSTTGHCQWHLHRPVAGSLQPIEHAVTQSKGNNNRGHVFGRFRIASFNGIDLAILVRHTDSPVYAFRLT